MLLFDCCGSAHVLGCFLVISVFSFVILVLIEDWLCVNAGDVDWLYCDSLLRARWADFPVGFVGMLGGLVCFCCVVV